MTRGRRITRLKTIDEWYADGEIDKFILDRLHLLGYIFVDELATVARMKEEYPQELTRLHRIGEWSGPRLLAAIERRKIQHYKVRLLKGIKTVRGTYYPEDTVFYSVCVHPFIRAHEERGGAWMAESVPDGDRIINLTLMGDEVEFLEDADE